MFDPFGIVKQILDADGVFRSLWEPWADTSTAFGWLMLAVLDGLADVERELIRSRNSERRLKASLKGGTLAALAISQNTRRPRPGEGGTMAPA